MDQKTALSIVHIDELDLQGDCVQLPSQYLRVTFQAGELRNQLAQVELETKEQEAKISKAVRDNPGKHGIDKPTRDAVDEVVAASPVLVAKRKQAQDIRFELDKMQGVLSALEIKKRSLSNLVQLWSMSYHGGVKVSKEQRNDINEATHRKVVEKGRAVRRSSQGDEDED